MQEVLDFTRVFGSLSLMSPQELDWDSEIIPDGDDPEISLYGYWAIKGTIEKKKKMQQYVSVCALSALRAAETSSRATLVFEMKYENADYKVIVYHDISVANLIITPYNSNDANTHGRVDLLDFNRAEFATLKITSMFSHPMKRQILSSLSDIMRLGLDVVVDAQVIELGYSHIEAKTIPYTMDVIKARSSHFGVVPTDKRWTIADLGWESKVNAWLKVNNNYIDSPP
ncbi:hypothetical protein H0H81_012392 [Sphagnurus paluster]|uniref:Uncharacterized protein n=1 Tax=Sphagnurus paluster TaxID=117069 RepID=A0A9P7GI14_9AGAR|nr:hypothetical protein H0H81_012392 [Sphagnurus paluster]